MLDLSLAVLHHLIVFTLFGVVFAELMIVRPGMSEEAVRRAARIDAWYGILAGLIVIVGFTRANVAAKGWDYYSVNAYFWAKIGTFVIIGLLSIPPTMALRKWCKEGGSPSSERITAARRFIVLEVILFAPLLVFAAAMARGYGMP